MRQRGRTTAWPVVLVSCWSVVMHQSCESERAPQSPPDARAKDAAVPDSVPSPKELGQPDGPPVEDQCAEADQITCEDQYTQRVCRWQEGRLQWVSESCAAEALCLDQRCSTGCLDQCDLDQTRSANGVTETCRPFSVAGNEVIPLNQERLLHRAWTYNAWLRQHHLPSGYVVNVNFKDAALSAVDSYHGSGDSAIWSGSYLAAEALRSLVTGSPEAQTHLQLMVERIHDLFQITGHPGYLARFIGPIGHGDPLVEALFEPAEESHHAVTFKGKEHYWRGDTSRDQYQGVLLGYGLAYRALTSEPHRQLIRDDLVTLCQELLKVRTGVTITVRFNLMGNWITLPIPVDLQYVVLNPSEYKDGGPFAQFGSAEASSDYAESSMTGMQEFMPDLSQLLKQIPGLGQLITFSIPRSGSATMLAAILRLGMLVTEGQPSYAGVHNDIRQHYDQNIAQWLEHMSIHIGPNPCWKSYYGYNINFQPAYSLLQLEDDPALKADLAERMLQGQLWPDVKDHKNVFFNYIYAANAPYWAYQEADQAVATANAQLAQFWRAPKVKVAVDNTGGYTESTECANQATEPIEVKDRAAEDFQWQRHPFTFRSGGSNRTYPGVDYLLAYWLGRYHEFLDDDSPGMCLRWMP